ncbi:MAG: toxin, partial [Phenylobacterium sp.]|nr:toxin [Phenylobacterium sp.]
MGLSMPALFILPTQQNGLVHFINGSPGVTLTGTSGADTFDQNRGGAAQMTGGQGDDYYYATSPGQGVTEQPGEGLDTVFLAFGFGGSAYALPANVENLYLEMKTGLTITGNASDNDISGQWSSRPSQNTIDAGAGNDIITVGTDSDVITGGAGSDIFRFTVVPWGSATITDFHVGEDILDFRQMFTGRGYTGSDPIADGWLKLEADGAGGTRVMFDPDGPAGTAYGFFQIADLRGVAPTTLTAQQDWYFKTPADDPAVGSFQANLYEANLPNGTSPNSASLTQAGYIHVDVPRGASDIWVGGHQVMSGGVFTPASFTLPEGDTLKVSGYDPSQHLLTVAFTLATAEHQTGDAFESFQVLVRDTSGAMGSGNFMTLIHDDLPRPQEDRAGAPAGGAVTGNVLTNDIAGADGGLHVISIQPPSSSTGGSLGPNGAVVAGNYGTLTIHADGSYSYAANSNAPAGAEDFFLYRVADTDDANGPGANLVVTIGASPPP